MVFDMDETLGYFVQINILWNVLYQYCITYKFEFNIHTQLYFNCLLDLYPEFIRNNIYPILKYVKRKKINKECTKVLVYTNNKGNNGWIYKILKYIENKIKYPLFDMVLGAFDTDNPTISNIRSTHDKTYTDLINCANIHTNSEICMIDNSHFSIRHHHNVNYIKINSYIHNLPYFTLFDRFVNSDLFKLSLNNKEHFLSFIDLHLTNQVIIQHERTYTTNIIDNTNAKRIMLQLQYFFDNKPKHHKTNTNNRTRKKAK